eukprot:Nitzschia sp. Nitz4//scaffold189_size62959//44644//45903//NITZ4_006315-RA/size62959-processed-gene-0.25-mRNA-1//1//CDS//3329539917//7157//frame0
MIAIVPKRRGFVPFKGCLFLSFFGPFIVQLFSSTSPPSGFAHAYDNGLGLTPPMGWNSWNYFNCDIHETAIRETASALVEHGLDKLGYTYVNLDDCWQLSRNASGYIQEDPTKFPSGIPALREYIHSLGLKIGLYSDAGMFTCKRRPGGMGYETKDAATYAAWEIDYLKYDNCYNLGMDVKWRYHRMHKALNSTGRPIFFSMCEWGEERPAKWAKSIGNSWRTTHDINPTWKRILHRLHQNDNWHAYAGPGGWNDPDMLEVGNGDLTQGQQRAHFSLWCLIKAPLLLGNDLRNISSSVLDIISNTEVIAWNQDPLGVQGNLRMKSNGIEVWAGALSKEQAAVVLLNTQNVIRNNTISWEAMGLPSGTTYKVRDVWKHEDLGKYDDDSNWTVSVNPRDILALHLTPVADVQTLQQLRSSR